MSDTITPTDPVWTDSNLSTASAMQMTTKAWAVANTLSAVKARLDQDNANRVDEYNRQFAAYAQGQLDRPDPNIAPPVPAIAEVVVFDESGWPEVGPGTERVCAQKVYQPPKVNPTLGSSFMGRFASNGVGPESTPFNGSVPLFAVTVTASDGSQWIRVK